MKSGPFCVAALRVQRNARRTSYTRFVHRASYCRAAIVSRAKKTVALRTAVAMFEVVSLAKREEGVSIWSCHE